MLLTWRYEKFSKAETRRKPSNVLITTPETFQLMSTGHRIRELLISTRCVIEEIHDLISSERGWQLEVGLSRLEHLKGSKIQRLDYQPRLEILKKYQTGLVKMFL